MRRSALFVFGTLLFSIPCWGQVPPGPPFDAAKHPNPILTYVGNSSFKPATYEEAKDAADIELIGLSQRDAQRESIQLAETSLKRVRLGARDIDVTFYPVVRQVFKLSSGNDFVLHSFKFPKTAIPPQLAPQILNEAAFAKTKKPADARFGTAALPEMLDIRGGDALLFDNDGELTIFWTEEGIAHTATAKVSQKELFRLVEDLL